ncbi:adhesion G protein-coupled receptor E3-like [Acanthaster planci]|uniref:Adhesion G protein-coupled receptor E3-like n=1 Tax=Acanthaster planci TaxID=133434 RepID=A0A8B7ZZL4_ACAPL|nr:adhesion G protein-coupled receptor E3-like [Acanthaster planci]
MGFTLSIRSSCDGMKRVKMVTADAQLVSVILRIAFMATFVSQVSSSSEVYQMLMLDRGILRVNTSDATWRYSADDSATELDKILRGNLEDRVYTDDTDKQWHYQVAVFRHNGSIVLNGSLQVSFSGGPAVSVESLHGDIKIATRLILDGYLNLASETGSLGGYGARRGPGGGGLLAEDGKPPKPPGGGGHGGTGGEAFIERTLSLSGDKLIWKETKYGYPYLIGDGYHLLGGSAGGKIEYEPNVLVFGNPKGGGALEVTAKGKITIGSHVSADGQRGIPYDAAFLDRYSAEPCAGGGSGGLIRLRAKEIEVRHDGFLSVRGADGAQNTDNGSYCGGGGAGGIIEFQISDRVHGYLLGDHLFLNGGKGTKLGGRGRLEITNFMPRNGSRSCDDSVVDCDCTSQPSMTVSPSVTGSPGEPNEGCPTVQPAPCDCSECPEATSPMTEVGTSDCGDAVTCQTTSEATDRDCSKTVCPTVPDEGVSCKCPENTDSPPSTTEALTLDNAAQFLEEALDEIGEFGENSTREGAVQLLVATEILGLNLGSRLAEARQPGEVVSVTAASETVAMQVQVDDANAFSGVAFPNASDLIFSLDGWRAPFLCQEITEFHAKENISGDIIIVNVLYADIGELLTGTDPTEGIVPLVNSRVVGTSVALSENVTTHFTLSVRMTAEKLKRNISGTTSCVFWDFHAQGTPGGSWSPKGCLVEYENDTHVICMCDHLTNFATLLKPDKVVIPPGDEFALGVISYIGLGLSLCSLVLAFITISVSLKGLKNFQSAVIHLNLIAALGLADTLFLIGADDTENQLWCRAVAIMLHYFYLSTFMWMLCEGFHIYIRVTTVFADVRGHLKYYFFAAWGISAVIVGVTAGVNLQGYGTATACWLDAGGNTLWAFAAPVALIVTMNVFFLGMIMYRFLTVKSIAKKSKYEQLRKATRAAIVLLPLLGTTWIFGLLALGTASVVMYYIFVTLNSLQGVFICIFHCLTNDDVAATMRVKLRRSRTKIDIFLTSADRKTQPKSKCAESKHSNGSSTSRNPPGTSTSEDAPQSSRWATYPPQARQESTRPVKCGSIAAEPPNLRS